MTAITDPTGHAGYAAILANPSCVTTRLQFADWLQEQDDTREKCGYCKEGLIENGGGSVVLPKWTQCLKCNGTGSGRVKYGADLAEFIRVQVELAKWKGKDHDHCPTCGEHWKWRAGVGETEWTDCRNGHRWRSMDHKHLHVRESELRKRYQSEWLRAGDQCNCTSDGETCWGGDAGGLLREFFYGRTVMERNNDDEPVRVEFTNGFPGAVTVPLLSDVVEDATPHIDTRNGRTWQPTTWLRAVVKHHPVTRFVAMDREPYNPTGLNYLFYWRRDCLNFPEPSAATLPSVIFDGLPGVDANTIAMPFLTRQDAVRALALVVGQFVRNHITKNPDQVSA